MPRTTGPARTERSRYIRERGIKQFGIPWTLLFAALQVWHGEAPALSFRTWHSAVAGLWFVVTLIVAGVIAGALFGYFWWLFERWLLGAPD